ncbi:MAG: N-acetylmuramic acid 6-phosphate etherase [Candidatus Melainabacteria bacterium RIFOXYA12_FULL_32_12]|nr:MAG: N-acetylmuramic acid 6-phosphate etherase [Candidatus Melainabacteria bacterium RIFOXYA2_FULL_32_9]OGI30028.1 MAG: N-acetylmuramic acid 6-phosphate etherase [Candidatus Melainabacteria bacterium RIFOXYA12_FULL_32_12]
MENLILTEKRNPNTINIDLLSSRDIVELINKEDYKVAEAVNKELDKVAKAVDIITHSFLNNGNLLYFGAGTSGRLGILDASECPPTFNANPDMVRGYIAGGDVAIKKAVEGAEDSFEAGITDLVNSGAKAGDVVIGISASGNAPYIQGVLKKAKELNISTIGLACNKQAKIKEYSDILIAPEVGEEVITGSTRMKAGTAQKMVLNMLTTASMIRTGKTYENYMIDVQPTNNKLRDRAARIVSEIAEVNYKTAQETLISNNYNVKISIIMLKASLSTKEAEELLQQHNGRLREALFTIK